MKSNIQKTEPATIKNLTEIAKSSRRLLLKIITLPSEALSYDDQQQINKWIRTTMLMRESIWALQYRLEENTHNQISSFAQLSKAKDIKKETKLSK